MKHLHNYLLFPTLSFKHILKIPLPVNALKSVLARFSYSSKNMSVLLPVYSD